MMSSPLNRDLKRQRGQGSTKRPRIEGAQVAIVAGPED
ncbi:hypothetical protein AGROH133_09982 [Agrobacterium tumefaciens]|nr:hypothetical protein AGROH133_09982 [Agrobacterium tumefaciens]